MNELGIYKAKVEVNGVAKRANSSFFPNDMTPQEIIDVIVEAYEVKKLEVGTTNTYIGIAKNGMKIEMYLSPYGKIKSVFPLM